MKNNGELSIIVKNVICLLAIPIISFGFYVILHGHLTPGGGFAGGAVLSTCVALFLVSFRKEIIKKNIRAELFLILESLALISFIGLALLGIQSSFFHNSLANSDLLFGMPVAFGINPGYMGTGGVVPLMNLAVGIEVFSGLSMILLVMTYFKTGGDKDG